MFKKWYRYTLSLSSFLKEIGWFLHPAKLPQKSFKACAFLMMMLQVITPVMAARSNDSWTSRGAGPKEDDWGGLATPLTRTASGSQPLVRRASIASPLSHEADVSVQYEADRGASHLSDSKIHIFSHLVRGALETMTPYERFRARLAIHEVVLGDLVLSTPEALIRIEEDEGGEGLRVTLPSFQALPHLTQWMNLSPRDVRVIKLSLLQRHVSDLDVYALLDFLENAPDTLMTVALHTPIRYGTAVRLLESPRSHLIFPSLAPLLGQDAVMALYTAHGQLWSPIQEDEGGSSQAPNLENIRQFFEEHYGWRDEIGSHVSDSQLPMRLLDWAQRTLNKKLFNSLKNVFISSLELLQSDPVTGIGGRNITAEELEGIYSMPYMTELGRVSHRVRQTFYHYLENGCVRPEARTFFTNLVGRIESHEDFEEEMAEQSLQFLHPQSILLAQLAREPQLNLEVDLAAAGASGVEPAYLDSLGPDEIDSMVPFSIHAAPRLMAQKDTMTLSRFTPVHLKDMQMEWLRFEIRDDVMIGVLREVLQETQVRWLSLNVAGAPDVLFSSEEGQHNSVPNLLRNLPYLERVFLHFNAPEVGHGGGARVYDLTYAHLLALFEVATVPVSLSQETLGEREYPVEWLERIIALNKMIIPGEGEEEYAQAMQERATLIEEFRQKYLWQDDFFKALGRHEGLLEFLQWVEEKGLNEKLLQAFYAWQDKDEGAGSESSTPSRSTTISPVPGASPASFHSPARRMRRSLSGALSEILEGFTPVQAFPRTTGSDA